MSSFVVAGIVAALTVQSSTQPVLRIVVLEGENGVNIIQQKTAVRPLVEVRDRNNVPVAGVTVTFAIGGGQPAAFAGGVQTLTVTTNAAGQAAATGFTALGPGAIQVQVQAAYHGQIATAAISQTNFATAAAASQAGAASGASGSSTASTGAATTGGGGGVSGTTVGIAGAAIAGGALAATQLGGDDTAAATPPPAPVTFTGTFTGQLIVTVNSAPAGGATATCQTPYSMTGTLTITLVDGISRGDALLKESRTYAPTDGAGQCPPAVPTLMADFSGEASGGPSNLAFRAENNYSGPIVNGTGTSKEVVTFTGSLTGDTISGSFTFHTEGVGTTTSNGIVYNSNLSGSTTIAVTLR